MALSKSEQKNQKDLNSLRPKKTIAAVKDQTNHQWNDDLFVKEKTYKTDKGEFRVTKADWRKLHLKGVAILAIQGHKLSKDEYKVISTLSKSEQAVYISAKSKPKAEPKAEPVEEIIE